MKEALSGGHAQGTLTGWPFAPSTAPSQSPVPIWDLDVTDARMPMKSLTRRVYASSMSKFGNERGINIPFQWSGGHGYSKNSNRKESSYELHLDLASIKIYGR